MNVVGLVVSQACTERVCASLVSLATSRAWMSRSNPRGIARTVGAITRELRSIGVLSQRTTYSFVNENSAFYNLLNALSLPVLMRLP